MDIQCLARNRGLTSWHRPAACESNFEPPRPARHSAAAAVVCRQVVDDDFSVGRFDRRAEHLDHLVRLPSAIPSVQEGRICARIIEAVAGGTVVFDNLPARTVLERYRLLLARPTEAVPIMRKIGQQKRASSGSLSAAVDRQRQRNIVVIARRIENQPVGLGLTDAVARPGDDRDTCRRARREAESPGTKGEAAEILARAPPPATPCPPFDRDLDPADAIAAVPGDAARSPPVWLARTCCPLPEKRSRVHYHLGDRLVGRRHLALKMLDDRELPARNPIGALHPETVERLGPASIVTRCFIQ